MPAVTPKDVPMEAQMEPTWSCLGQSSGEPWRGAVVLTWEPKGFCSSSSSSSAALVEESVVCRPRTSGIVFVTAFIVDVRPSGERRGEERRREREPRPADGDGVFCRGVLAMPPEATGRSEPADLDLLYGGRGGWADGRGGRRNRCLDGFDGRWRGVSTVRMWEHGKAAERARSGRRVRVLTSRPYRANKGGRRFRGWWMGCWLRARPRTKKRKKEEKRKRKEKRRKKKKKKNSTGQGTQPIKEAASV